MPARKSQQVSQTPPAPGPTQPDTAQPDTAQPDTAQPIATQPDNAVPVAALLTWEELREQLQRRKARINEEISSYPMPITGCDAQFNYLLEQRGGITEELTRLEAALRESLEQAGNGQVDSGAALAELITLSEFIDGEAGD